MVSILEYIAFAVLPYVMLLLFIVGVIYRVAGWVKARGLTGLYTVSVMPGSYSSGKIAAEVLKRMFTMYTLTNADKPLLVGSAIFHWGIWIALIGHIGMIVDPQTLGVSREVQKVVALYVGGTAGVLAMVGLLILLARRLAMPSVRAISFLDDYFALILLLLIVILGNLQTLVIRPDYMATVAPWIQSILSLSPDPSYIVGTHPVTKAHILLAMLFIAYIPFGKIMHLFSMPLMPTLVNKSIRL